MITETNIYKYGIFIENIVIKYLQEIEQVSILEKHNNNYKYDLIIKDTEDIIFKIEIKACRQAFKTNNFYIEYVSNGKPSGINTTQSDILIYVVEHEYKYMIYWINIIHLKNYIDTNNEKIKIGTTKSIENEGNFNGKMNKGYLININDDIYYKIHELIKSNIL